MSDWPIELQAPDLEGLRQGNTGIEHVWSWTAEEAGPHLVLNALMHGNELSGAIALVRLMEAGIRPQRGRITMAFANVEAFRRFDPAEPFASRFVEEDMNRVWSEAQLRGAGGSLELRRARELLPVFTRADLLLDLHSMQTPSPALTLSGRRVKGMRLAAAIGCPALVVADDGHANGTRLIDHGPFADTDSAQAAVLVETGQHWAAGAAEVALETALRFLLAGGVVGAAEARALMPHHEAAAQQFVEVTHAVTARSTRFAFVRRFTGMEVIPEAGTLLATDDGSELRTPYENCVLVMPTLSAKPGLTAVRLGRFVPPPG
ncbi:succinylglutamate desuccinylase/aspartoacylase family protein [Geminicoccaceae bacterium 1502E]|nr:succinylglutamate desuccinylase/aspartoacylase family protein [Geminicoccaceae bacterium 1502E]